MILGRKNAFIVWLSVAVIAVVVLIADYPALKLNFYADDYSFVETAGRSSLPQYLSFYFDPRAQTGWYRPMQGMLFGVEYVLFGVNPIGYHFVNLLVHLANCLLLFAIVRRVAKRWRVAFVAVLIYAALPLYSVSVFWPGDADFILTFFYLAALLGWIRFLQEGKRAFYIAAFVSFLLALLTKEFGVTLPVILFLADRLLIHQSISRRMLVRCYIPFLAVWIFYLPLELYIQSRSVLTQLYGYGLGSHTFSNLFQYLAWLAFPWGLPEPINYIWLGIAAFLALYFLVAKKIVWLAFLGVAAVLTFLPVINFPWFFTRYLYLSVMACAVMLGILIDWVWTQRKRFFIAFSVGIALVVAVNSFGTTNAANDFAEIGRQTRVAFRDISQRHATFPDDTLLYFIDPPQPQSQYSGMFFVRYGPGVHVSSTEATQQRADLRLHQSAYVIYFDAEKRTREIQWDTVSAIDNRIPYDVNLPMRLMGYEIPSTVAKRNDALVVILYWQAPQRIDKDYQVVLQLSDRTQTRVFAETKQAPSNPTTAWKPGDWVVDAHVLPVPNDMPLASGFVLQMYLVDSATGQRASQNIEFTRVSVLE